MKRMEGILCNKKIIFLMLFLVFLLTLNTIVSAADMDVIVGLNNDTVYFNKIVDSVVTFKNIAPGDGVDYTIKIKNETPKNINLYFIEATKNINIDKLNTIALDIYIDGSLYLSGTANDIAEKFIYNMNSNEEIDILIKIGLSKHAGNEFQDVILNITWKVGAVGEYKEDEDLKVSIIEEITEGNDNNISQSEDGKIIMIPKTGESKIIYYILYILIFVILVYIIILLFKKDKKEDDGEKIIKYK